MVTERSTASAAPRRPPIGRQECATRERKEEREGKETSVLSVLFILKTKSHINIKNGYRYRLVVCSECADGGGFV